MTDYEKAIARVIRDELKAQAEAKRHSGDYGDYVDNPQAGPSYIVYEGLLDVDALARQVALVVKLSIDKRAD